MERRLKQFIFGLLYVLIFLGIGYLLFLAWAPKPSCNDQKHNQGEEDVDCGGPCAACQKGASLVIRQSGAFTIPGTNRTSFLMEVKNTSSDLWVRKFSYTIGVYNILGAAIPITSGESFVPPGGLRRIIVVGVNIDARDIYKIIPTISNVRWSNAKEFISEPIRLDGVKTEKMSDQTIRVRGVIVNEGSNFKNKIIIGSILKDNSGKAINVSSTTVEGLSGFSNKSFEIFFPSTKEAYNPDLTDIFFETVE